MDFLKRTFKGPIPYLILAGIGLWIGLTLLLPPGFKGISMKLLPVPK